MLPAFNWHVAQWRNIAGSGTVDKPVEPAEAGIDLLESSLDFPLVRDVRTDAVDVLSGLDAYLLRRSLKLLHILAENDDSGPQLGKSGCEAASDTAATARDTDHTVFDAE